MKKIVKALFGGIACATVAFTLASCGEDATTTGTTQTQTTAPDVQYFTVTYYDGDTVLKTEKVEEGKKATSFTPEKEGVKFIGWYGTPKFTHKYDFTKKVTGDISLFACFKNATYTEDTRTWYILGNGSKGLLKQSGWGTTINDSMMLTKKDVEGANVYEITLDLYEGDEFQFGINSSWHNQRGAGYLVSTLYEGTEYVVSASGLAKDTRKSNIKVAVEGNYTFTLTTNPNEDYYDTKDASYTSENREAFNYNDFDEITYTYNGAVKGDDVVVPEPDLESYQLIIKGTMTSWEPSSRYDSENLKVSFNYTFAKDDEFGFAWFKDATDTGWGTYINYTAIGTTGNGNSNFYAADHDNGNDNFKALEAGEYTIIIEISKDRVPTVNFVVAE